MRRFISGLVSVVVLFSFGTSWSEENKFYVIPVDKVTEGQMYSSKELQSIFRDHVNSYQGKPFWGLVKKNGENLVNGVSYPATITGVASDDLAASCYRCGLARSDLVKKEDCLSYGLAWDVASLDTLRSACN